MHVRNVCVRLEGHDRLRPFMIRGCLQSWGSRGTDLLVRPGEAQGGPETCKTRSSLAASQLETGWISGAHLTKQQASCIIGCTAWI